jgi:hypothetical protein
MNENVVNKLGGAGVWGVIILCVLLVAFIGMIVWVLCLKRPLIREMRQLPLDKSSAPKSEADPAANSDRGRLSL